MEGSPLRRGLAPARLALVRLRAAPGRAALIALGVALGAAMLALSLGGSAAVRDEAVQRELVQLGPSDASLQVVWSGVPAQASVPVARLDAAAREALRSIAPGRPFAVSLFRQAGFGGAFVNLGAVDGLARWVRVVSGRLPRKCTPASCELLRIGAGNDATPKLPFLHVVGNAVLRSDAPLRAYFGAHGAPLLLADGAFVLDTLPIQDSDLIARTYGWVQPLASSSLHDWQIPSLAARVDSADTKLASVDPVFGVSAPLDALRAVHAQAHVAGQRLLLVGGDAAVLLLAFAVLAAAGRRRDSDDARRRLVWSGADGRQLAVFTFVDAVGVAVVGALAGWLAGVGCAALLARSLGAEAGAVVGHSVLSGDGLLLATVLAVVAALVVVASLRARLASFGSRTLTTADVAALGAATAIALAVARGDAGAGGVGDGTGAFLLLLPALVVLVATVVAARLLSPVFRGLGRVRAALPLRLASLSLARRGGSALVAAAFLVVSVGIALFAATYRATLERGQRDQAAFAVPADYVISEDLSRLVPIQRVAPARFASLGEAVQVVRASGDLRGRGVTVVGLPAATMPDVQGWRDQPRADDLRTLAIGTPPLDGVDVHAGTFTLPVRVRGTQVTLTLDVRKPRGDFAAVPLGTVETGAHVLRARVPAGRIIALRLSYPSVAAFLSGHRESGTAYSVPNASRGTLELPQPYASWLGAGGVTTRGGTIHYLVNRAAVSLLRPRASTDGAPVSAYVTPGLAALGRVLTLTVNGAPLTVEVAGTTRWFPSVRGEAIVADRDTLDAALNSTRPGASVASEVWVLQSQRRAAAELAAPPFDQFAIASHARRLHDLRRDPLARGTLDLLSITALVALVLALAGVLLTVVTDRRDESGELFDLRAQGATPGELRRYLRVRAALVAAAGVVGGVATGAILAALVSSVVAVTAGAGTPVPPLVLALDWRLLLVGAVAFFAAAWLLIVGATSRRLA